MIRVCAWCKKILGEKEPLDDPTVTHGICDECLAEKMTQLDAWCKEIVEEKEGDDDDC